MVFGTTASSTRKDAGAATILERHFKRELSWLACRHHMFELIMRSVNRKILVPVLGHQILSSLQSRKKWVQLKMEDHDSLPIDDREWLLLQRENVAKELQKFLESQDKTPFLKEE